MKYLASLLILASLALTSCDGVVNFVTNPPAEQRVVGDGDFKLRISRWYVRWQIIIPDSTYLIESTSGNDRWRRSFSWTQDDPWNLSDINVTVVNDKVGYFFNRSVYGVTFDSGENWTLNHIDDMPEAKVIAKMRVNYDRADMRATVNESGSASIYFQEFADKNAPRRELYTSSDFGQTWSLSPTVFTPMK